MDNRQDSISRLNGMIQFLYRISLSLTRYLGNWFFLMIAKFIALGYFILLPGRVRNSIRFYRALFADRNFGYHLWCAWRQYQSFTRVFIDRFNLLEASGISYSSDGWHHLEEVVKSKQGGIILMSHLGNWEIAAHLLKQRQPELKLLLYLGSKHKEQVEKLQKESLAENGARIIAVDQNGGSPFLLLEAIKWMNEGGLVSLTGDMIWTRDQKSVAVDVLNHQAKIPETPHMLALISGKPLFFMFSIPTGKNHFRIEIGEPVYVRAETRKERKQAVAQSAQLYADRLMETAQKYPYQWFHFEPFIR
jgi:predicted LPLAT superfamily acyltransferase